NSSGSNDLVNNVVNGDNTNTATVTLSGPNLVQSFSGTISGAKPLTSNPQLGPLQNNGGPAPTMGTPNSKPAPPGGVPVAGVTTDQRGFPRRGTPSLGAFEAVSATTTTASNATATFSDSTQDVTLSATVSSGAGVVNEGTVTFTLKQGSTATTSGTV